MEGRDEERQKGRRKETKDGGKEGRKEERKEGGKGEEGERRKDGEKKEDRKEGAKKARFLLGIRVRAGIFHSLSGKRTPTIPALPPDVSRLFCSQKATGRGDLRAN